MLWVPVGPVCWTCGCVKVSTKSAPGKGLYWIGTAYFQTLISVSAASPFVKVEDDLILRVWNVTSDTCKGGRAALETKTRAKIGGAMAEN